jgi:hypothetical protein
MRISKTLAVTAAGMSIAAAVSLPAVAGASHHTTPNVKTKVFPSTLSPKTGIKTGTTMVMKGHGAKKDTGYTCVQGVQKGAKYWVNFGNVMPVQSSHKGKVKCTTTFAAYTATQAPGGPKGSHRCPLSKSDKHHGYSCSMSIATADRTSAANQLFKTK